MCSNDLREHMQTQNKGSKLNGFQNYRTSNPNNSFASIEFDIKKEKLLPHVRKQGTFQKKSSLKPEVNQMSKAKMTPKKADQFSSKTSLYKVNEKKNVVKKSISKPSNVGNPFLISSTSTNQKPSLNMFGKKASVPLFNPLKNLQGLGSFIKANDNIVQLKLFEIVEKCSIEPNIQSKEVEEAWNIILKTPISQIFLKFNEDLKSSVVRQSILKNLETISISKKDIIYQKGDEMNGFYLVCDGAVEGRKLKDQFIKVGSSINERKISEEDSSLSDDIDEMLKKHENGTELSERQLSHYYTTPSCSKDDDQKSSGSETSNNSDKKSKPNKRFGFNAKKEDSDDEKPKPKRFGFNAKKEDSEEEKPKPKGFAFNTKKYHIESDENSKVEIDKEKLSEDFSSSGDISIECKGNKKKSSNIFEKKTEKSKTNTNLHVDIDSSQQSSSQVIFKEKNKIDTENFLKSDQIIKVTNRNGTTSEKNIENTNSPFKYDEDYQGFENHQSKDIEVPAFGNNFDEENDSKNQLNSDLKNNEIFNKENTEKKMQIDMKIAETNKKNNAEYSFQSFTEKISKKRFDTEISEIQSIKSTEMNKKNQPGFEDNEFSDNLDIKSESYNMNRTYESIEDSDNNLKFLIDDKKSDRTHSKYKINVSCYKAEKSENDKKIENSDSSIDCGSELSKEKSYKESQSQNLAIETRSKTNKCTSLSMISKSSDAKKPPSTKNEIFVEEKPQFQKKGSDEDLNDIQAQQDSKKAPSPFGIKAPSPFGLKAPSPIETHKHSFLPEKVMLQTTESVSKKGPMKFFKHSDSCVTVTDTWRDRCKNARASLQMRFVDENAIDFVDLIDNAEEIIVEQNVKKNIEKNMISEVFRAFVSGTLENVKNEINTIRRNVTKIQTPENLALKSTLINSYEPWERRKQNRALSGDIFGGFKGLSRNKDAVEGEFEDEYCSNFFVRASEDTKLLHFNVKKFLAQIQVLRINKEVTQFFSGVNIINEEEFELKNVLFKSGKVMEMVCSNVLMEEEHGIENFYFLIRGSVLVTKICYDEICDDTHPNVRINIDKKDKSKMINCATINETEILGYENLVTSNPGEKYDFTFTVSSSTAIVFKISIEELTKKSTYFRYKTFEDFIEETKKNSLTRCQSWFKKFDYIKSTKTELKNRDKPKNIANFTDPYSLTPTIEKTDFFPVNNAKCKENVQKEIIILNKLIPEEKVTSCNKENYYKELNAADIMRKNIDTKKKENISQSFNDSMNYTKKFTLYKYNQKTAEINKSKYNQEEKLKQSIDEYTKDIYNIESFISQTPNLKAEDSNTNQKDFIKQKQFITKELTSKTDVSNSHKNIKKLKIPEMDKLAASKMKSSSLPKITSVDINSRNGSVISGKNQHATLSSVFQDFDETAKIEHKAKFNSAKHSRTQDKDPYVPCFLNKAKINIFRRERNLGNIECQFDQFHNTYDKSLVNVKSNMTRDSIQRNDIQKAFMERINSENSTPRDGQKTLSTGLYGTRKLYEEQFLNQNSKLNKKSITNLRNNDILNDKQANRYDSVISLQNNSTKYPFKNPNLIQKKYKVKSFYFNSFHDTQNQPKNLSSTQKIQALPEHFTISKGFTEKNHSPNNNNAYNTKKDSKRQLKDIQNVNNISTKCKFFDRISPKNMTQPIINQTKYTKELTPNDSRNLFRDSNYNPLGARNKKCSVGQTNNQSNLNNTSHSKKNSSLVLEIKSS